MKSCNHFRNTWKDTPWEKYDEAVSPRKSMLYEMPSPEDGTPSATTSDHRQTLIFYFSIYISSLCGSSAHTESLAMMPPETIVSNPDDPSEFEPHARTEGVGMDGSQSAYSVDPRSSRETPDQRAARQKQVIATCVKSCTMPLCVRACHAIADPAKLDDLVPSAKPPYQHHLQQAVSAPDQDWRSFVKKCEDTCQIEECRQMCRAAGAKQRSEPEAAAMHYDPTTADEATGESRDTLAAEQAVQGAPILPPPLPKGVLPPTDGTMMASMDGQETGDNEHVVEQAKTQELAEVRLSRMKFRY